MTNTPMRERLARALADIVAKYEQGNVATMRSASPGYKVWERHSINAILAELREPSEAKDS